MKPNITTGPRQAPVAVTTTCEHGRHSIFLQIIQTPLNTPLLSLEPSVHQVPCHPAQEGCSFCSVCSVKSSEADLHVDRLLCDSQPYNLTESAECPWTWTQGEAVRASLKASHSGSDPGRLSALGHISLPLGASVSSSVKWRW